MYNFFAYLNRMKHIERWSLMHSIKKENIMEHSQAVAVLAHCLAIVENEIFNAKIDEYKTLCYAIYHEVSEVITGDLPTPIKYFNAGIKTAYKELESYANEKLIKALPEKLEKRYKEFIFLDEKSIEYKLTKAADKLAAYIKCIEEIKSGNSEFKKARQTIEKDIKAMDINSVKYFMENFIKSYELSLDELE